jgi:serine/threonine-protein kinase
MLSVNAFLDELRKWNLVERAQLEELARQIQGQSIGPRTLACQLIERGWLTPFQANYLHQGRGRELLLGSYLLLERLGEGGMGAVFKARNCKLDRVVAVKVIRKERINSRDSIRRFQREIRAAGQLRHPNIVHALDADEVGGNYLLVMEYVDGTDLGQLVQNQGPLPVPQACDCIRQAALALAHAHEQGLVHRDIKPSNLLLSSAGQIKLLDLGLARLPASADGVSSTMTETGTIIGTPDFLAPEQARHSHDVDIRADLYSLGCTFYFLLTGRPPFPDGTITEKLVQHQLEEPEPIERLRNDVPPGLIAVVRKLLAKKPEQRYQTPTEVADVLERGGEPDAPIPPMPAKKETAPARAGMVDPVSTVSLDSSGLEPQPRRRRYLPLLAVAAVVLLGLALAGLWIGTMIASLRR